MPFTTEQFLGVFESYNLYFWPFQVVLNVLGIIAVVLVLLKNSFSDRLVAGLVAFFWIWIGIAYHIAFFATINPAAYVFGALFILQGLLFFFGGVVGRKLTFAYQEDLFGTVGWITIVYSMVLYPIIGRMLGHAYPKSPTFGLPCPTTIFTFGLLLWTRGRVPVVYLIIPVLWAIIGFNAAISFGIFEDTGLLLSGALTLMLILIRNKRLTVQQNPI